MNKSTLKQKYQREVDKIIDKIVTKYKPEKIIAFGSTTSAKIDENSDIDLLVIKDDKRRFIDRVGEVSEMFTHNLPVDIIVYTPEEVDRLTTWGDPFIKTVLSKGQVLYG